MASLACYMLLVLLAAVWIYHMIRNLWIAAVIGIAGEAALAITYVVKSTLFEGSIQKFLSVFDITSHFDNFTNGILDLQGVVYFLSVIIIFLVLTVQTITKRRWKYGGWKNENQYQKEIKIGGEAPSKEWEASIKNP